MRVNENLELVARIDCANTLGEGVVWNASRQCVMWVDIQASRLYRASPPFSDFEVFETPERIGSFALVDGTDDVILAAFETGFGFFEFATGRVEWVTRPDLPPTGRFNDGRTDRTGIFWAGVMIEDPVLAKQAQGSLMRLSPTGDAQVILTGVEIPNSLCWSPDGTVMYFADSPSGQIKRYAIEAEGRPGEGELFASTERGASPDGSTIDANGFLWNAEWGSGRVTRYSPDGDVDVRVALPAPQVTCPAFGGENLDLLFVTSAREDLSETALADAPQSGSLFVFKTPYRGLVEPRCASKPRTL